jgi:hypothetical protein
MEAVDLVLAELSDIPFITEPAVVRQKSRDFFWYSPVLNRQLRYQAGRFAMLLEEVRRFDVDGWMGGVPLA